MTIMPTNDNIIVKLPEEPKEQKTASGIVVVGSNQGPSKPDRGEVMAVGTGRVLANGDILKPSINQGDQIIFNRFAGTEVLVGEEKYLIIKENDILAIVK